MATPWQPQEDALALDMRSRGKTAGQIAFRVPRSKHAIYSRLRLLSLKEQGIRWRQAPPIVREGRAG